MKDLYNHGVFPKSRLGSLWLFDDKVIETAAALNRRNDGDTIMGKTLLTILVSEDVIFDETAIFNDVCSGTIRELYFIPEVWALRRGQGQSDKENPAEIQNFTHKKHVMIGWRISFKGWPMASFLRKFVWKCATALTEMSESPGRGKFVITSNSVFWQSDAWPGEETALAFVIEKKMQQKLIFIKIAGQLNGTCMMRDMSLGIIRLIESLMREEKIETIERKIGFLLPQDEVTEPLHWVEEAVVKKNFKEGVHRIKLTNSSGKAHTFSTDYFDLDAPSDQIFPNFEIDVYLGAKRYCTGPTAEFFNAFYDLPAIIPVT